MEVLDKALIFATQAHKGQYRKVGGLPYILHPMEVCTIVATMTKDESVMAAALLHDTVEDTNVEMKKIYQEFGKKIGDLVDEETENKREDQSKSATWQIRKEESMEKMASAPKEAKMIVLADKLSNIRSIAARYRQVGDVLFEEFNMKDKAMHFWYYQSIAHIVHDDLAEYDAYREYQQLVKEVFQGEQDENNTDR